MAIGDLLAGIHLDHKSEGGGGNIENTTEIVKKTIIDGLDKEEVKILENLLSELERNIKIVLGKDEKGKKFDDISDLGERLVTMYEFLENQCSKRLSEGNPPIDVVEDLVKKVQEFINKHKLSLPIEE